jgi:hypothetical protein
LNALFNPFPRTRIMAQALTYDVGQAGRYDALLDYALAEYTFDDYIGIRAGRIQRQQGIYNDIQDVDLGRTFVLLPQGVYDARWRDFYVSLDGGELFGTIPLRKAGSLDYDLYGGVLRPSLDGGIALEIRNSLPASTHLDELAAPTMVGGQFWWNTPLEGLRLGAGGGFISGFGYSLTTNTLAGTIHTDSRSDQLLQQYSAEYLWKAWTFQTEFLLLNTRNQTGGISDFRTFSWYASAEYRFNKWLEAGGYYTEYYDNTPASGLVAPSDAFQKDGAIALRFDLTNRWIFKVEGHLIHGTALLDDNAANPARSDNGWWLIAVKSTISF